MHRVLVLVIALGVAMINGANGANETTSAPSTGDSLVSQALAFADFKVNGTSVWIIVTVVAAICGLIILVLLILLCYACCCRKTKAVPGRNVTKEERQYLIKQGNTEKFTRDCQTEFIPANFNTVLAETGTMTKRSAYRKTVDTSVRKQAFVESAGPGVMAATTAAVISQSQPYTVAQQSYPVMATSYQQQPVVQPYPMMASYPPMIQRQVTNAAPMVQQSTTYVTEQQRQTEQGQTSVNYLSTHPYRKPRQLIELHFGNDNTLTMAHHGPTRPVIANPGVPGQPISVISPPQIVTDPNNPAAANPLMYRFY